MIAKKTETGYNLYLQLRNNRCDETHPDGIFHAHAEYHNIKSEAIGLIEAMGLFILPARLNRQLFTEGVQYLCGKEFSPENLPDDMKVHSDMIALLLERHGNSLSETEAKDAIRQRINEVCFEILRNTAVFPETDAGSRAFESFVKETL